MLSPHCKAKWTQTGNSHKVADFLTKNSFFNILRWNVGIPLDGDTQQAIKNTRGKFGEKRQRSGTFPLFKVMRRDVKEESCRPRAWERTPQEP